MKQYFQICTCITTFKTAWVTKWFLVLNCLLLWTCQYEKRVWMMLPGSNFKMKKYSFCGNSENLYFFGPSRSKSEKHYVLDNLVTCGSFDSAFIQWATLAWILTLSLTIYYCNSCYPYHCHYLYYDYWSTLCFSFLVAVHYNNNWFKICCSPSQILGP